MNEYTVEVVGDFDADTPQEAADQFRNWVAGNQRFSVRVTNTSTLQVTEVEL